MDKTQEKPKTFDQWWETQIVDGDRRSREYYRSIVYAAWMNGECVNLARAEQAEKRCLALILDREKVVADRDGLATDNAILLKKLTELGVEGVNLQS